MGLIDAGKLYADSEVQCFPRTWDDKTRQLVRFMILEAFIAGSSAGHEAGLNKAFEIASAKVEELRERELTAFERFLHNMTPENQEKWLAAGLDLMIKEREGQG